MEEQPRFHIAIIAVADLPEGSGRTSRLKTLASAFREAGGQVTILIEHALTATPGQKPLGVFPENDIPFEFILGKTERPFGFGATVMKFRAVLALARRLGQMRRKNQLDLVVFNNLALYDTLPLTLWARRRGVATIQCYEDERQELVSTEKVSLARRLFGLNSWLADRICPSRADAIIVISGYLSEKYRELARGRCKVFLIPPFIDCGLWQAPLEVQCERPVLLYAGFFSEQDEIETVVEALALLKRRGRNFLLRLIGADSELERVKKLKVRIEELRMLDRVDVQGFVPLATVRKAIFESNLLISLRRDSVWSRSGQSTKLSEFLASGRLVIASTVGDNVKYLRDRESALLVHAAASPKEIAAAIDPALQSIELRQAIGAAGRQVAIENFDQRVVSKKLHHIIETICPPSPTNV